MLYSAARYLIANFMKNSLQCFAKTFISSKFLLLLAILGIILFLRLGYWQIERGHEKQEMLSSFSDKQMEPTVFLQSINYSPVQYQKVRVKGYFLPKIFLLDNQYRNHKFGFNVIQPLLLDNGAVVLIDRGWVLIASRINFTLPKINFDKKVEEIVGMAYFPSGKGFLLGEPLEKINKQFLIIEAQDPILISKILHKSVYQFIIRETGNYKSQFLQEWPIVSMSPSRHYAYAFQWFGLAIVLIIILIFLKKKHV